MFPAEPPEGSVWITPARWREGKQEVKPLLFIRTPGGGEVHVSGQSVRRHTGNVTLLWWKRADTRTRTGCINFKWSYGFVRLSSANHEMANPNIVTAENAQNVCGFSFRRWVRGEEGTAKHRFTLFDRFILIILIRITRQNRSASSRSSWKH